MAASLSSTTSISGYEVPENIWKVLPKQLAYLSGTTKCSYDIVCVPEVLDQASKQDGFIDNFESTLIFLKYCISQREAPLQGRTTMILVLSKKMAADKLKEVLKTIERVFTGDSRVLCKAKNEPKGCSSVSFVHKKDGFVSVVGEVQQVPKDFGGKATHSFSQHKQWMKYRQELENLNTYAMKTETSMNAAVEAMKPDFSLGALANSKNLLKTHTKDKESFCTNVLKLKNSLSGLESSLKSTKNAAMLADWSTMQHRCQQVSQSLKDTEREYKKRWGEHKKWLDWRVKCFFFVDEVSKVKAYFKHVVDSFEVSTDELEDKEKLLLSVQRSRAMWQRMRECTTEDPAQSKNPCLKQFMSTLIESDLAKCPIGYQQWMEETRHMLVHQLDALTESCQSALHDALEKFDLLKKAGSIHVYFAEHRKWCVASDRTLAEALGYNGRDKIQKMKIRDALLKCAEDQPLLEADVLAKFERLLDLFTPRVQEVKLNGEKVMDRLQKQLKAWGFSLEATDGGGLGDVYQELLDSEEKYVRELEIIVEGYLKTVEEEPSDLAIPVRMKESPQDVFGNARDLYHFHEMEFLPKLKRAGCNPMKISQVFSDSMSNMEGYYSFYCKNYDQNKAIIEGSQAQKEFQAEMEIRLKHVEPLPRLLAIPCTRINVYKQLLINMVKYASNQPSKNELQVPIALLTKVLQLVDRSVSEKYGKTLLDDVMKVRLPKTHLLRVTFKDRHVVLYERALSICRASDRAGKGNKKATPQGKEKAVVMLSELHMPSVVPGNPQQFTVAKDRRDIILVDAGSVTKCKLWVEQLQKILSEQLQHAKTKSPSKSNLMDIQNAQVIRTTSPTSSVNPEMPAKSKPSIWPWKKAKSMPSKANRKVVDPKVVTSLDLGRKNPSHDDDTGYEGDSFDDTSDEDETHKECKNFDGMTTLYCVVKEYSHSDGEYPITIYKGEVVEGYSHENDYLWIKRLVDSGDRGWVPVDCLQEL